MTSLSDALFSKVQLRVLTLFFGNPTQAYQLSEAIKLIGSGSGAVQRELEKLTATGIIITSTQGSRKLYQANRLSPVFDELRGLILKTSGLLEPLRDALGPLERRIASAFVYGSVARKEDTAKSDIDVMIIGSDISYGDVYTALQKAERTLKRPINPNVMGLEEWSKKVLAKNSFVRKVMQQPKLFIIGSKDELSGIGQSR